MEPLISSLQSALAVAMATTFDDNIYLTGFFSETDRHFRPVHVVAGELIGFSVLIGSSFLASRLLANTIPITVTGWLGTLPILIGIHSLTELVQQPQTRSLTPSRSPADQGPRQGFHSSRPGLRSVLIDRRTYNVSAITISNGGNNLAIYIPLLGTSSLGSALITVLTCYAAVLGWLLLSFRLTRLPGVAIVLARHASRIFPFVLMWLGFRILSDSGVLTPR